MVVAYNTTITLYYIFIHHVIDITYKKQEVDWFTLRKYKDIFLRSHKCVILILEYSSLVFTHLPFWNLIFSVADFALRLSVCVGVI